MQALMPRCRQCVLCGNPIEGKGRIDRIYCSASCRTLAWRVRVSKRWGGRPRPEPGVPPSDPSPPVERPTLASLHAELESAAAREVELKQQLLQATGDLQSAAAREVEFKRQLLQATGDLQSAATREAGYKKLLDWQSTELARTGAREQTQKKRADDQTTELERAAASAAAQKRRVDDQTAELERAADREAALQVQLDTLLDARRQLEKQARSNTERTDELETANTTLQRELTDLRQAYTELRAAQGPRRRRRAPAGNKAARARRARPPSNKGTRGSPKQVAPATKQPANPRPARPQELARPASPAPTLRSLSEERAPGPRPQLPSHSQVPKPASTLVKGQSAPLNTQRRPPEVGAQPYALTMHEVPNPVANPAARPSETAKQRPSEVAQNKPASKRKPRLKGATRAPRKKKSSWLTTAAKVVAGTAAAVAIGLGMARATKS